MTRTVWTTLLVLATAATVGLPAQRNRDRDFGLSQEEWCRDARRSDVCEVREETLSNVRTVDLDARGNGGVAVRGWDRPDVHVRARVVVYADSDAEAKQIASEIKLVTTGGRIRAEGPSRERGWWRDRGWSVSFELEVPRNADLTVGATNGGVSVRDVRGRMDLRTVNGGLSLEDVSGDIRGETTNGGVDIRMTGDKWEGPGARSADRQRRDQPGAALESLGGARRARRQRRHPRGLSHHGERADQQPARAAGNDRLRRAEDSRVGHQRRDHDHAPVRSGHSQLQYPTPKRHSSTFQSLGVGALGSWELPHGTLSR